MRQILQDLKNGNTLLEDIPAPQPGNGCVLIETNMSLVSAGTERMLVEFGKASLFSKARQQPEKVKMVLDKVMTDGLVPTLEAVRSKLDTPIPLGYCNVGTVLDGGDTAFKVGQRVASNGSHAEVVKVPKNLVALVPDSVSDETAAFTVIGSIALQGIRLISPSLGDSVVVTGLGLIGLLAVQILRASGCRVMGIDYDSAKCALASSFGAQVVDLSKGEDPITAAEIFSKGFGVDAVLIAASSKSNDVVHQSATMCRKRGKIVLVGVIGLELNRADFYEKELSFQVSCSYGPGRYDKNYEEMGLDYPFSFVRWTEQRNFEAVLELMAQGSIEVGELITHRYKLSDATEAYAQLDHGRALGILLQYNSTDHRTAIKSTINLKEVPKIITEPNVAFIGAGNYASRVLIPAFKGEGANLVSLVTGGGVSGVHHGKKHGFSNTSTSFDSALVDEVDTIVIVTQHNLHADQVIRGIEFGKNVYVEKPLAINLDELERVELAIADCSYAVSLMVGFNRRFAPNVQKMKSLLSRTKSPKSFIFTMNAGAIPDDHWVQNREIGGGRVIGEACHYIDLMRFLADSPIVSFSAINMGETNPSSKIEDKVIVSLSFEDGSIGAIHYFANGGKAFPKERIEVFCDEAVLQLDNFKTLRGFGWGGFSSQRLLVQNKGQKECVAAFLSSIKAGESSPIPIEEIFEVSRISIQVAESLR